MVRAVTKHTITGNFGGEVELEYDAVTGLMVYMGIRADLSGDRHAKFLEVLPKHVSGLATINRAPIVVTTISKEVTFDDFWEAYNYKVDKEVAKNRWGNLTAKDRVAAFNYIPAYEDFLKKKTVAKLMPSTYLNKKRWNDNK